MRKTNFLLFGNAGSGKSTAVASIFKFARQEPDIKIRYLMTEQNAIYGLEDGLALHGINLKEGQLIYKICKPTTSAMSVNSKLIAQNFEKNFVDEISADAQKVAIIGGERAKHNTFYNILAGLAKFTGVDMATGKTVDCGDYLAWDDKTVFVIDSLTACIDYLLDAVKASRISVVQSDYMNVQNNIMSSVIIPLTEQAKCSIVMLGHPVLGEDPNVKQPKEYENKIMRVYVQTFGQKLNTKLPSRFTEVIYAYNDNQDRFFWAGKKLGIDTSPRILPRKDKLPPDFSNYNLFGLKAELIQAIKPPQKGKVPGV